VQEQIPCTLCSDVSESPRWVPTQWNTLHTPALPPKELSQVPGEGMLMNVKLLGGITDVKMVPLTKHGRLYRTKWKAFQLSTGYYWTKD